MSLRDTTNSESLAELVASEIAYYFSKTPGTVASAIRMGAKDGRVFMQRHDGPGPPHQLTISVHEDTR